MKKHGSTTNDASKSVGNANATGYGTHININITGLTGRVYSFTNADLFYCDGVAIMPIISMTANGVR
ncbi:hypothetical protein [Lelliottia amnigena]|uniref:hypothetical protein n=1 Tax=Lelliottia amnigena TaxID=61646 RepID=UPI00192C9F48|nr:hypothetical protein [Lelliottia amnigena]MBL5928712.1 hypothetical protein [Lelliottia amnigena]QXB22625.1 hypothetical protein I6L76_04620 [Lelliottia amnigena]